MAESLAGAPGALLLLQLAAHEHPSTCMPATHLGEPGSWLPLGLGLGVGVIRGENQRRGGWRDGVCVCLLLKQTNLLSFHG